MSTYATLKNCVAINRTYDIEGHYSWQSGRDLTYSYFGGIACEVPKHYYGGCFSNKDVNITTSHLKGNYSMENGSTSNTASQMNSAAFVDELNLYSQIEFDKDNWMLDENEKLSIKFDFNENTGEYDITAGFDETAPCEYFSLSGVKMGNVKESLAPGVYIVRQGGKAKKITVK